MTDSSRFFNILAILGALAWLPPLITLMKNIFIKPTVTIFSGNSIEIGYTLFGPIINPSLAFLSEHKDALINSVKLKLVHETNESHLFSWEWFDEVLSETVFPASSLITKRHQNAIAIKLPVSTLIEKKVGFIETQFKSNRDILTTKLKTQFSNLFGKPNFETAMPCSSEFNDLIRHCENSFCWKPGKYTIDLDVYISKRGKPFHHGMSFFLTDPDIKYLQTNVGMIRANISNQWVRKDPNYSETWNWVYPEKAKA